MDHLGDPCRCPGPSLLNLPPHMLQRQSLKRPLHGTSPALTSPTPPTSRLTDGKRAVRKQVVRARRQATVESATSKLDSLGVLCNHAVTEPTRRRYHKCYTSFVRWAAQRRLSLDAAPGMDAALTRRLDEMYTEGLPNTEGVYLVASVAFYHPTYRGEGKQKLGRTRQALRGFAKLAPQASRMPWPWEVVAMMANALAQAGSSEMALFMVMAFELYLRPGEATKLRAVDLTPPVRNRPQHSYYTIVVAPSECEDPTKTGEFDHALALDLPRHALLGPIVERHLEAKFGRGWRTRELASERRGQVSQLKIFDVKTPAIMAKLKGLMQNLKANVGDIHLHRLRHAGASHDYITGTRDLKEVRRRGRWLSWRSVRRYEKGARVAGLLHLLGEPLQDHAGKCADNIYRVLSNARSPVRGL